MLKSITLFIIGFVGTVLVLNAITWLFGQAVAAIVAWFIALGALAMLVIGVTVTGKELPPMSEEQAEALKKYMATVS